MGNVGLDSPMPYREDIATDLAQQKNRATEQGALWQRICDQFAVGGERAVAAVIEAEAEGLSREVDDLVKRLFERL